MGIFITVFGTLGASDKIDLDAKAKQFERGSVDEFEFETVDLGDLRNVRIGHDNKGIGASWFLDNVVVSSVRTGDSWTFPCNQWLDKAQGDGALVRELGVAK